MHLSEPQACVASPRLTQPTRKKGAAQPRPNRPSHHQPLSNRKLHINAARQTVASCRQASKTAAALMPKPKSDTWLNMLWCPGKPSSAHQQLTKCTIKELTRASPQAQRTRTTKPAHTGDTHSMSEPVNAGRASAPNAAQESEAHLTPWRHQSAERQPWCQARQEGLVGGASGIHTADMGTHQGLPSLTGPLSAWTTNGCRSQLTTRPLTNAARLGGCTQHSNVTLQQRL